MERIVGWCLSLVYYGLLVVVLVYLGAILGALFGVGG
jgi:hypothetical protein